MIYVYAIKSLAHDWIYVGMTSNVGERISQHNLGYNKSTKPYRPFKLIHQEEFSSRMEARKMEKYYKSAAGKRKLRKLL